MKWCQLRRRLIGSAVDLSAVAKKGFDDWYVTGERSDMQRRQTELKKKRKRC
jgi:hypothetical protein